MTEEEPPEPDEIEALRECGRQMGHAIAAAIVRQNKPADAKGPVAEGCLHLASAYAYAALKDEHPEAASALSAIVYGKRAKPPKPADGRSMTARLARGASG